ncbi:unnamed protein product [Diatraea saccharalis]|uniref:Uncharacterized protein n=1 Tax=Diatraea saccharalis TaxID=40085 RepID=A0A9N9R8B2_9NEOP|nr:unnamed protein product [Diatraea saccharalis]
MDNKECDLSCDPANPRRHEVPGPHGVKSVTEDCVEVSNQASALVNTTGKRLVQQSLYPKLFVRTRSSSLGNISPTEIATTIVQDTLTPNPPDWQRIPISRNQKRKDRNFSPLRLKKS